ncbi:hypothetical protein VOLCADRAFT_119303 [Volvox carteri f. nagariensis]|uniref:Peptidase M3A/M3B catalytic domain-containing protein n=1 Tax=Volvox carteri f. nagariensis TaxID=3068 RepID=D8UC19_VOLCA|nr:uncharacterized protein VOLCADRAFT_119303 [Volvox carteri f. nagariensis]EFJ42770.1 hypothetical protein VOLCADRAFT_119303 [Volvox carteri f. nagariensis]|eukprot:XP_002956231.1 hypothetical protein VOLCADRAFT_119303 [Volvox carteri f. nagariensis]
MDHLLAELRTMTAVSRHTAIHHVSPDWREAAAEVATACAKYETYVFQAADGDLLAKLDLTSQRLATQMKTLLLQQQQQQQQPQQQQQQQQPQQQQQQAMMNLRLQMRLCELLRRSLLRGGAGLEDGEDEGGGAALSRLYAVRTAPSNLQLKLTRMLTAERDAAAAVDAAVLYGPGPEPLALPLAQLCEALQAGRRLRSPDHCHGSSELHSEPYDELLYQDPLLGPMLTAAAAAGVPRAVRAAVYEAGFLPRLAAALQRLGELAVVRQRLAALQGYCSFVDLSYSRAGLAVADGEAVLALLQDTAEVLSREAEEEVQQLREALGAEAQREGGKEGEKRGEGAEGGEEGGRDTVGGGPQGQEDSQDKLNRKGNSNSSSRNSSDGGVTGDSGQGVRDSSFAGGCYSGGSVPQRRDVPTAADGWPLPDLAPWDVDYARELLMRRRGLPPDPSELEPYMHLYAVLYGLSEELSDLMHVRIKVAEDVDALNDADVAEGVGWHSSPVLAPELWDPRVVRVTVWSERGLVGVVYLHPGSGYGTRQLRFPAGASNGDPDSTGGSGALPYNADHESSVAAVAIGLQAEWRNGRTGSPAALHELLHEMGHALHLLLSAAAPRPVDGGGGGDAGGGRTLMHFSGIHLPLDVLEVPSSLLQTLAYDPAVLARICRRRRRGCGRRHVSASGVGCPPMVGAVKEPDTEDDEAAAAAEEEEEKEVEEEEHMPAALCNLVAVYLAAENCSAVTTLSKVLVSLVDQVLHADGGDAASAASAATQQYGTQKQRGVDVGLVWQAVRQAYGVVPNCPGSLKELAMLPPLAHHQATFHTYLIGLLAASALRQAPHPFRPAPADATEAVMAPPGPPPWAGVRELVFEAGGCDEPGHLLARMLAGVPPRRKCQSSASAGNGVFPLGMAPREVAPLLCTLAGLARGFAGAGSGGVDDEYEAGDGGD